MSPWSNVPAFVHGFGHIVMDGTPISAMGYQPGIFIVVEMKEQRQSVAEAGRSTADVWADLRMESSQAPTVFRT